MQRVYLEYRGDSIELPLGATVVGRDVGCLLRFNDPSVSRQHLRFVHRQDEVFLEDLQSSNGTLLNGRVVTASVRVEDGDTIVFGNRLMTVRMTDDEGTAASTVLLKSMEAANEQIASRNTARIPLMLPKPTRSSEGHDQQCPRCGGTVTELDDECANCNYHWGTFRPRSVTDIRPHQIVNRRRHDRRPVELSLVYVSSELEVEAVTRDLSESGVFVCSQVLDPVGTSCHLTILVDGGPPLEARGIVRRVVEHDQPGGEPIGLGVEFVGVGRHELTWITRTIARMAADGDDGEPTRS